MQVNLEPDHHTQKFCEASEAYRESVLAYRESASSVLEIDNALLAGARRLFGEGYGPNGLLICQYVDVIAKATVENSRSRSELDLPANPGKIKQAIRDVAELAIRRQEDEFALEPLQLAYTFLARFLPESQASLVTKYNLAWFSEDPNHPELPSSEEEEAKSIEGEVDAEQDRLGQEFDKMIIECLENERAKHLRKKAKIEIEMAKAFFEMSPGDPASVT